MVGAGAFHALAVFDAAPEVAAADDDADFAAEAHRFGDRFDDAVDHVVVEAETGFTGQRFAADLDEHAFIFEFVQNQSLRFFRGFAPLSSAVYGIAHCPLLF